MRVYIIDPENAKYYRAELSRAQALRLDNGALISCGLTVGRDLSRRQLARLQVTEVTAEEWNHSGCQSSCTLRGAAKCSW